ncbi:MAG: ATP-binding cassette domain-containing protein, partial [Chloroflexia bacterium]|nr:ATP-binding cassette domain-containing protein [Chloroflexia bacterium]
QQTVNAIDSLCLTVRQGEFLVLCGPSGGGKTTLLKSLKPSLTPHGRREGQILFEGIPLESLDFRALSAQIGFVMQDPDNQLVTDKGRGQHGSVAKEQPVLALFAHHLCAGNVIGRPQLRQQRSDSVAERRRLEIAVSLRRFQSQHAPVVQVGRLAQPLNGAGNRARVRSIRLHCPVGRA